MALTPPKHTTMPPKENERTPLSHQLMVTRVIGKSCLGLGFIISIFGVTNAQPAITRTGLALLLIGILATIVSFVHTFKRHRQNRR